MSSHESCLPFTADGSRGAPTVNTRPTLCGYPNLGAPITARGLLCCRLGEELWSMMARFTHYGHSQPLITCVCLRWASRRPLIGLRIRQHEQLVRSAGIRPLSSRARKPSPRRSSRCNYNRRRHNILSLYTTMPTSWQNIVVSLQLQPCTQDIHLPPRLSHLSRCPTRDSTSNSSAPHIHSGPQPPSNLS